MTPKSSPKMTLALKIQGWTKCHRPLISTHSRIESKIRWSLSFPIIFLSSFSPITLTLLFFLAYRSWDKNKSVEAKQTLSIYIQPFNPSGKSHPEMANTLHEVEGDLGKGQNWVWQVEKLGHATDWGRVHTDSMHSSTWGGRLRLRGY